LFCLSIFLMQRWAAWFIFSGTYFTGQKALFNLQDLLVALPTS